MAIKLIAMVFKLRMAPTLKLVFLSFADAADRYSAECWPSIRRIAAKASISQRQCQRLTHELIELEWIFVLANHAGGAKGQTRRYRINTPKLASETRRDDLLPDKMSPVSPMSSGRVTSAHATPDACVTQTNKQPSYEPHNGGTICELIVPPGILDTDRTALRTLVNGLPISLAQAILDEVSARLQTGGIKKSVVSYARSLVKRSVEGEFVPAAGLAIAEQRRGIARTDLEIAKRRAERNERDARVLACKKDPESKERIQAEIAQCGFLFGRRGSRQL